MNWQRHRELAARRQRQLERQYNARWLPSPRLHFPELFPTLPAELPRGTWRHMAAPGEVTRPLPPALAGSYAARGAITRARQTAAVARLNAAAAAERAINRARWPNVGSMPYGVPLERSGSRRHTYLGRQQYPAPAYQRGLGYANRPLYAAAGWAVPRLDRNLDRTRAAYWRFAGAMARSYGSTLFSGISPAIAAGMLARDIMRTWPQLAPAARGLGLPTLIYRFARTHPWETAAMLALEMLFALHHQLERGGWLGPAPGEDVEELLTGGWTKYGQCPHFDTQDYRFAIRLGENPPNLIPGYANNCLSGQAHTHTTCAPSLAAGATTYPTGYNEIIGYGAFTGSRWTVTEYWFRPNSTRHTPWTYEPAYKTDPRTRMLPHPMPYRVPMPAPGRQLLGVPEPGETLPGESYTPPSNRPPPVSAAPLRPLFQRGGKRDHKNDHIGKPGTLRKIRFLVEFAFEADEKSRALYEALPKCRLARIYKQLGRQPNPAEKGYYAWKYSGEINPALAAFNFANEFFGNYFVALPSQQGQKAHKQMAQFSQVWGLTPIGVPGRFEGRWSGMYGDPRRFGGEDAMGDAPDSSPRGDNLAEYLLSHFGAELLGRDEPLKKSQIRAGLRAYDAPCGE